MILRHLNNWKWFYLISTLYQILVFIQYIHLLNQVYDYHLGHDNLRFLCLWLEFGEGKLVLQTNRFQTNNNNNIIGGEKGGGLLKIRKCYQYENDVFARLDIFSSTWMPDTTAGKKDDWKSRQHLPRKQKGWGKWIGNRNKATGLVFLA